MTGSTCTVSEGNATFSIATGQIVRWTATGSWVPGGTLGDGFWLTNSGATAPGTIELTSNLTSGPHAGTHFLNAGTYSIAVGDSRMGPGSYSIEYNLTATLSITPPLTRTLADAVVGTGVGSDVETFTVAVPSSSDWPVRLESITSSDAAHFPLSGLPSLPVEITPGGSRTFQVRFNPGSVPSPFSSTLTVSGSSVPPGVTVAPATATVSATALPAVPNIACSAGSCAAAASSARADGDVGATTTFSVSFQNTGTAPLVVSSVNLVHEPATAPAVFTVLSGGGGGTIPGPGSRTVNIRFAPPAGEAVYCGYLEIVSNDPDTPVKRCYFQATAHHPVPRMVIAATTINYGEVELGFSFHRAIVVRNTGDAPLTISLTQLCEAPGAPCAGDLDQFAPDVLGGPFTIPPITGEQLIEQIYTPTEVATHTIQVRVSGNDATNPSQDLTLTGQGRAPIPIDSVLVLDRSGSMDEPAGPQRKIDALRRAADLYVNLLRRGTDAATSDGLGMVKYNGERSTLLALAPMLPAHVAAAQTAVDAASVTDPARLAPTGSTGIGGAMQHGATMLLPPSPDNARKHVLVVMTDGHETDSPWVRDVIGDIRAADPNLKIYSVGLGTEISPEVLAQITTVTNGRFLATSNLTGIHRYQLETFYFKIFSNATGMSIVVDPTTPVALGGGAPIVVGTARLVSSDRHVTFLLLDEPELRALYTLELVDPGGHIIDVGSFVGGVPVHISRRENYALYRIDLPSLAMSASYTGDWIIRLTPRENPDINIRQLFTHQQDFIDISKGLVPIGFGVAVGSDYRMETAATSPSTLPGAEVTLTTRFTDRGAPSAGVSVTVNVTRPDGFEIPTVPLFDDGTHGDAVANDSTWTAIFTDTSIAGVYEFLFRGVGRNDRNELVPREDSRWVPLVPPTPPDNDKDGRPGGDGDRRIWWSVHLGHNFPLGNLAETYDPAASLTLDLELPLTKKYSAYAMLGHHYFHGKQQPDLTVTNFSLNLRRYFSGWSQLVFAEVGPGLYRETGGSTFGGGNVGGGILFPVTATFGVELGTNLHAFGGSPVQLFIDTTLGVRFRF